MKLVFTKEDFDMDNYPDIYEGGMSAETQAKRANAKLNAYIKKYGRIVYGENLRHSDIEFASYQSTENTHKAVLINIEEIKPCIHEPEFRRESIVGEQAYTISYFMVPYCKNCGVKLKPSGWEAE